MADAIFNNQPRISAFIEHQAQARRNIGFLKGELDCRRVEE
ncbi:hypothetical protein QFZ27_005043 [Inquilinus ginsengisoli]